MIIANKLSLRTKFFVLTKSQKIKMKYSLNKFVDTLFFHSCNRPALSSIALHLILLNFVAASISTLRTPSLLSLVCNLTPLVTSEIFRFFSSSLRTHLTYTSPQLLYLSLFQFQTIYISATSLPHFTLILCTEQSGWLYRIRGRSTKRPR